LLTGVAQRAVGDRGRVGRVEHDATICSSTMADEYGEERR
jgi:hypothetical protein